VVITFYTKVSMMSIFFCVALDIIIYLAPVKSPFPGERGQGDRDSKLEVCFKNRLFLQAGAIRIYRFNI